MNTVILARKPAGYGIFVKIGDYGRNVTIKDRTMSKIAEECPFSRKLHDEDGEFFICMEDKCEYECHPERCHRYNKLVKIN